MKLVKLVFIGAGSLGMLFAGKLSHAQGQSAILIAHGEDQARRLNESGLTVVRAYDGSGARHTSAVASVSFDEAERSERWRARIGEADWLMLMVKQQHLTESLLSFIGRVKGAHTKLLCFQNGLGHADRLSAYVPGECIYVAVTTEGARKSGTHTVEHTGAGVTWFGRAFAAPEARGRRESGLPEQTQPRAGTTSQPQEHGDFSAAFEPCEKKLEKLMQKAGFTARVSNQMDKFVWNKLLINSVINPLTAIHQIRNGQLLQSRFLMKTMRALYEEGRLLAGTLGVSVADDLWQQLLDVCARTAGNHSSMLQDLLAGRRTEIDWINGSLLRLAAGAGLSLPTHEAVFRAVKALEKRALS